MNPRELVDHIRSGSVKLVLDDALRFRRRTRSNPCDFNEFLEALQSNGTIRDVTCYSHQKLNISEDEWVLLVKILGRIKGIQRLTFYCTAGTRDFDPFQAVAEAANSAHSLCRLGLSLDDENFRRDPSGLIALADALRQHTTLQEFAWFDFAGEAVQDLSPDVVLRALPACTNIQSVRIITNCASTDAIQNLLQLPPSTKLSLMLKIEKYSAVADEIRRGRCNVQTLKLTMPCNTKPEATEAVKGLASAIQLDSNVEHLYLQFVGNGFTDEAFVALAEALTVNTTLRILKLSKSVHGFESYEAFARMLLINTKLVLELPPLDRCAPSERIFESFGQMRIEQRLNRVGRRRLLSSSQTTKEEWIDALHEMSSDDIDDDPDALRISCIFSLFRLNPEVVRMS
jgi:hypothetical protein